MGRLFGTDGIRAEAGRSPLTPAETRLLGRCAGRVLKTHAGPDGRLVIVRDTRASGPALFKNLSQGLREEGVNVYDAGVLCTPAVALLVKAHKFQSGAVISASHNPPEFNGIKFFSAHGQKWPDEWEEHVEKLFFAANGKGKTGSLKGQLVTAESLTDDYKSFLIHSLGTGADLSGLRIAVDCANGANFRTAPDVLAELGARVEKINTRPTGRNINVDCGSQHTKKLAALVRAKRCHAGVAFDGDGDRVIFVDEKGRELDGDYLLALLAKDLKQKGRLKNNLVVVTVMANLGLRKALSKLGVKMITTPVGDRHVSQAMRTHGAVLGGEQSGHIILGEHLPTGDGLLTALHLLAALKESGRPLSQMTAWVKKFPQLLMNVKVKERVPLQSIDGVSRQIRSVEKTLGSNGRVLVRYSGTEPLLRIMLEGPDEKRLNVYANSIAELVKKAQ